MILESLRTYPGRLEREMPQGLGNHFNRYVGSLEYGGVGVSGKAAGGTLDSMSVSPIPFMYF